MSRLAAIATLASLTTVAVAPARARADDEQQPGREGGAAEQAEDVYADYVVMLRSGERFVGRLAGVDERGRIILATRHVGDLPVGLPEIRAVVAREKAGQDASSGGALPALPKPVAPDGQDGATERVFLTSGERLRGELTAIDAEAVRFEVAGAGAVVWPRARIRQWVRVAPDEGAEEIPRPELAEGDDRIVLTDGAWLDGRVESLDDQGRVAIQGEFGEALLRRGRVSSILLAAPLPAEPSAGETAEGASEESVESQPEPPRGEPNTVLVLLRDGSVVGGRLVSLPQEQGLALQMSGGPALPLPHGTFRAIVPRGGGAAPFGWKVLVWGPHADEKDEHRKTVDYVKAALGADTEVNESTDLGLASRIEGALDGVRALVISEPERGSDKDVRETARKAGDALTRFVEMGGTIIVLGESKGRAGFLDELGLLKTSPGSSSVSGKQSLKMDVRSDPLLAGIKPGTLTAQNATMCYDVPKDGTVVLSEPRGKAIVIRRRVGLGHVVMMGYDMYEADGPTQKLLGNATKLGLADAP